LNNNTAIMSSIVNKVKNALHSDKHDDTTHNTHSTTTGTHGTTGTHTTGAHTTGTHTTGTGYSTNDGPHSSNMANKADPRVDSDRDHSRNAGVNPHGTATTETYGHSGATHGTGLTGSTGASGMGTHSAVGNTGHTGTSTLGSHNTSTNAGPHSSNLANKADPRVDSDLDRSRNAGVNPHGTSTTETYGRSGATTGTGLTGSHGTTGTHGTGLTGSHGTTGTGYNTSTNAGPHSSNLANKADPRVDSDLDRSRNAGVNPHGTSTTETYGRSGATTGTGLTGSHGTTGTHGTGLTGSHGTTGTHTGAGLGHTGPGPAPNTAGPHKSDALNKVDPRVDSDLDGSKTVGGNQTYSRA
jgi:hypothetical protein